MLHIIAFVLLWLVLIRNAVLQHPFWIFILYELVYFLNPASAWWADALPNVSYSFICVSLMFAFLLLYAAKTSSNLPKLTHSPHLLLSYLLGIYFIVATQYAAVPQAHERAMIYFIKLLLIISLAYKLIHKRTHLEFCLKAYCLGAAYIGYTCHVVGRNSAGRIEGVGTVDAPESNVIAATIAPALFVSFYYLWRQSKILSRVWFLGCGALIANGLILINSRGAFIATIAGGSYFIVKIFRSKNLVQRKKPFLGLILVVCLGLVSVIDQTMLSRFETIYSTELTSDKETGATRVYFWLSAIEMAKDYPLGQGYLGFDHHLPYYIESHIDTGGKANRSVHSTWFQALTEIGLHGLITFVILISFCIHSLSLCAMRAAGNQDEKGYFFILMIKSMLITYLISISFVNRLTAEFLYWMVLFCACAHNIYIVNDENRTNLN